MYVHAIQVYQKLLEGNDLEEYGQGLTAKVCHNLGCAFSYLFQMEKALEYFRKEWESGGERQALKTCFWRCTVCGQRKSIKLRPGNWEQTMSL